MNSFKSTEQTVKPQSVVATLQPEDPNNFPPSVAPSQGSQDRQPQGAVPQKFSPSQGQIWTDLAAALNRAQRNM